MTRTKRGRKKKRRKPNPGWFQKGFDARRSSYCFTPSDCRVGYLVAAIKHPELREWLKMRIRCFYHERSKHVPEKNGHGHGRAADCTAGIGTDRHDDSPGSDPDVACV